MTARWRPSAVKACIASFVVALTACATAQRTGPESVPPLGAATDWSLFAGCYLLTWVPDSARPTLDSLYLYASPRMLGLHPGSGGLAANSPWHPVGGCVPGGIDYICHEPQWWVTGRILQVAFAWNYYITALKTNEGFVGRAALPNGGERMLRARRVPCS